MSSLPPDSDARAALLLRRVFVASFFSNIPPSSLSWVSERLAGAAITMRAPAGTVLYRRGDPTECHYFVVEGAVRLEVEGESDWVLDAPALIGVYDHVAQRARSRTATVSADAHLLRIATEDWNEMLEDAFDVTRDLIENVCASVSQLLVELGEIDESAVPPVTAHAIAVHGPPLGVFDRVVALESIAVLATDDVQALANLAAVAEEVVFESGAPVTVRDVPDARFFLVLAGRVEGSRTADARVEVFGPGDLVFGASSLCVDATAFDAFATVPTRVLAIEREDYVNLLEEHFGLARAAMKALILEREALVNVQARRARAT